MIWIFNYGYWILNWNFDAKNHWANYVVAYYEIKRFSIFSFLGNSLWFEAWWFLLNIHGDWLLAFVFLFRIYLGECFLMFWWLVSFLYRHTVSCGCMHAILLIRLRGEGTFVPEARPSSWWGDDLSFVISSPVPSIRIASVANEYVRESGRGYCYMAIFPPFPFVCLFPIDSLFTRLW